MDAREGSECAAWIVNACEDIRFPKTPKMVQIPCLPFSNSFSRYGNHLCQAEEKQAMSFACGLSPAASLRNGPRAKAPGAFFTALPSMPTHGREESMGFLEPAGTQVELASLFIA